MVFDVKKAFTSVSLDQARIVAELGVWSAVADGDFEESEAAALVAAVSLVPGLEDWGVPEVESLISEMTAKYSTEELIAARVTEIVQELTDPHLQRCAYQMAALCAAANGEFSDEENEFLQALQVQFEIPDDVAESLVNDAVAAL